jgi:hypothetical protein
MKEAPALQFYQPQMHVAELMQAYTFFSKIIDEQSVPAYAHGDPNVSGAGNTASGLQQLIGASSRGIKAVVSNIDDDIIKPYIQRCYDYNLLNDNFPDAKGDINIVAGGINSINAKEQSASKQNEFLMAVANPLFAQILGTKKLNYLIDTVAKAHDIYFPSDIDSPEADDINPMMQGMPQLGQAGGNIAQGGTPPNPQQMLPDGSAAGAPQLQRS